MKNPLLLKLIKHIGTKVEKDQIEYNDEDKIYSFLSYYADEGWKR